MLLPYYNTKGPYEKCRYTHKYRHTYNFTYYILLRKMVVEVSKHLPLLIPHSTFWITQNRIETQARVYIFYAGPPQDRLICYSCVHAHSLLGSWQA